MASAKPTFSPVCTEPFVISAESRIRELRKYLSYKSQEYQKKNILALIHLYETGQLAGPTEETIWIFDGKVVDSDPDTIPPGSAVWTEEIAYQLIQTTQTTQAVDFQMLNRAFFGRFASGHLHDIFASFRLVPEYGGDPNITINVSIANDTGSTRQTIFTTDLTNLNYDRNTSQGGGGMTTVGTANGVVTRERIRIEIQLLTADGTPISPWFRELAIIKSALPGVPDFRLSGKAMREHFYFATAPGNTMLYVAKKREWHCNPASGCVGGDELPNVTVIVARFWLGV